MTKAFYKVRDIKSVRDIIDSSAKLYGKRNAFEIKKDNKLINITYKQYRDDINALSNSLINFGIADEKVAVISDNCYEYCMTYISVICSGGIIVPIDKELHPDDIKGIIDEVKVKIIFCDKKHLSKIKSLNYSDKIIVCFNFKEDSIINFNDFLIKGYEIEKAGNQLWKNINQDVNKTCTLLFTSGTVGIAKGVMLCQNNFVFEVKAAMSVLKIYPHDCGISLLPLHHTFESSIILFFAPYCGCKVTFCEGFKYVLKNMKEFNPSIFVAVPLVLETVHKRLLREIRKKKNGELKFKIGKILCKAASYFHINLKNIIFKEIIDTFGGNMRMIICGGAPIDPQIIKDFDAFGIQVVFGYGLTECAPLAIINHDRCKSTDSIGEPLPGVEVKLLNKEENGIGEICVKGGMVMNGYYHNQKETDKVIDKEGFFHTGDLGFVDKKGHYHTTGRCKNVIVTSNGKNIYPEELEYHLDSHPFINSSMVEASKEDSDKINAQIFPDIEEMTSVLGHEPTEDEVKSAVKEAVSLTNAKVASFKKISSFNIRKKDFIRTTAQKIKRNEN